MQLHQLAPSHISAPSHTTSLPPDQSSVAIATPPPLSTDAHTQSLLVHYSERLVEMVREKFTEL